ncbi:MAG: UDP-2,3-diacylglucosamine diphosphatase LpxI [Alphaproteobacteria bacterium]|nr:UDP-2,3-diacylglucosamine diphosphatase LpxI [Alphaproteobacteria bacterium]
MSNNPDKLAIIAGAGQLPQLLADACRAQGRAFSVVKMRGQSLDWLGAETVIEAEIERFGALFEALRTDNCGSVVFAGRIDRPNLQLERLDDVTRTLAPRLIPAIGRGDGTILRLIASIFEDQGLVIKAAHEILPELLALSGVMGQHAPSALDLADIARAEVLTGGLGQLDLGQAAVVAQGQCLGLETLQGTDIMLGFVAKTAQNLRPNPDGAKGVLFKGPKPSQDLRMDMPAIGVTSVELAAKAGLAGIAIKSGAVLMLDRAEIIARADQLGLFIYGTSDGLGADAQ